MPFTYFCFLLGSLAIMGFPFLTGFYSKEVIIEFAFKSYAIDAEFLYAVSVASACLTGLYSWRLLLFCFLNPSNNAHKQSHYALYKGKPEFADYMFLSMLCLAIGSIIFGFLFSDIMINLGTPFWGNSIHVLPSHNNLWNIENFSSFFNLFPLILVFWTFYIIAIVLQFNEWAKFKWLEKGFPINSLKGYLATNLNNKKTLWYENLLHWFPFFYLPKAGYNAFFFNKIYNFVFKRAYIFLYYSFFKYIEKGLFDFLWTASSHKITRHLISRLGFFLFFSPALFTTLLCTFLSISLIYLFFLYSFSLAPLFFCNLGCFFLVLWYVFGVRK